MKTFILGAVIGIAVFYFCTISTAIVLAAGFVLGYITAK